MKIQCLTIDSSESKTLMCETGAACGTDKSPYVKVGHRHPYTAVYDLLLSRFRYTPVKMCEIGVAGGASVLLWRYFFQNAQTQIHCFDCDINFLNNVRSFNLPGVFPQHMDVYSDESIQHGLHEAGGEFDVILDDSTHGLPEQVKVIKNGLPFLKSGGLFIIEDIFRDTPHERYELALEDVLNNFVSATFIITEHKDRFSPGWNNDKLLVLVKK